MHWCVSSVFQSQGAVLACRRDNQHGALRCWTNPRVGAWHGLRRTAHCNRGVVQTQRRGACCTDAVARCLSAGAMEQQVGHWPKFGRSFSPGPLAH